MNEFFSKIFQIPLPILLSAIVGFVPVVLWIRFVYLNETENSDTGENVKMKLRNLIVAFLLGTCTIPALHTFYKVIETNQRIDYYEILEQKMVKPYEETRKIYQPDSVEYRTATTVYEKHKAAYDSLTTAIDAFLEEVIKLSLLIVFVQCFKLIRTIGDAISYSVLAGLGFAYAENLLFFNKVFFENSLNVFINVVIFRTIILTLAHMTFSGIFGYFYGLSKFALPIYEEKKWEGDKFEGLSKIGKLLKVNIESMFRSTIFLEGLCLAMLTHATFNLFLAFGLRDYAVYIVITAGLYIYYLTQRKAGHLVLSSLGRRRMSLMAPKDEDVVLELAGMWINEGKYKEVEEMCARLEQKDPDNAVVKLLFARAHDKRRVKRARLALLSLFFQKDIFEDDISIFEKYRKRS